MKVGSDSEALIRELHQDSGGLRSSLDRQPLPRQAAPCASIGRGDDTVGNPHRAQIHRFELFELILLAKLDKLFPVEQLEATVSQSTAFIWPFDCSSISI